MVAYFTARKQPWDCYKWLQNIYIWTNWKQIIHPSQCLPFKHFQLLKCLKQDLYWIFLQVQGYKVRKQTGCFFVTWNSAKETTQPIRCISSLCWCNIWCCWLSTCCHRLWYSYICNLTELVMLVLPTKSATCSYGTNLGFYRGLEVTKCILRI